MEIPEIRTTDIMISDTTNIAGAGGCILAGGVPISLTASMPGPAHSVVFLDADGSGTYSDPLIPVGGGMVPLINGEAVVYLTFPITIPDGAPLTIINAPNYAGFAPSHPDVSPTYASEWDNFGMATVSMAASHGSNLRFIGTTNGVDTFNGWEAIVDDANTNGIIDELTLNELLDGDIASRGGTGAGTLHQNFLGGVAYSSTTPISIFDDSVGTTPGSLDKAADELEAITIHEAAAHTAVRTTDYTNLQI